MSIESVMPSNHLFLCCPLLLLPSIFPSIRVFSNESAFHFKQPKNWSFSFSISPLNEYAGFISFRIDWFGHLAVQGDFFSSTTIQKHQFFSGHFVQLSHPYMTTGKTIALTRQTFVGKVMSLLCNTWLSLTLQNLNRDFQKKSMSGYCVLCVYFFRKFRKIGFLMT